MTNTTFYTRRLATIVGIILAAALLTYTLPASAQLESRSDQQATDQNDREAVDNSSSTDDTDEDENVGFNNSRSNRATVVGDDAGDTDADGRSDVSRQPDFNDQDDDGDGVSDREATDRNESDLEFVRTRANITKEIDKASPHIRALRGIDKATPALYERIRTSGLLCPEEDCDDKDEDVRPGAEERRLHALRIEVSGDEVRGASEDAKAEVRARLQAADEANDANDFGIRVALAAIDNESIDNIESDDEETIIRYRVPARIFGFIPAELRVRIEASADGERVRYPWYAFLVSKEDQPDLLELAAELRANHEAILSAAAEEE